MDIDKDLAEPDDTLRRFYDGAYLYRSNSNDFDINKFDRFYEQYREKRKREMKKKMIKKLAELNIPEEKIPIYNESIGSILTNMKDSLFQLMDDILQHKFTINTFTKNNRLFYLGLIFVIVACIMYLYSMFGSESKKYQPPKFEIRYIQ